MTVTKMNFNVKGGHELRIHPMWLRCVKKSIHSTKADNIPARLRLLRINFNESTHMYEELKSLALFVKERTKMIYWLSRACSQSARVMIKYDRKNTTARLLFVYSV